MTLCLYSPYTGVVTVARRELARPKGHPDCQPSLATPRTKDKLVESSRTKDAEESTNDKSTLIKVTSNVGTRRIKIAGAEDSVPSPQRTPRE